MQVYNTSVEDDEMPDDLARKADEVSYGYYHDAMVEAGETPVSFARFVYELRCD